MIKSNRQPNANSLIQKQDRLRNKKHTNHAIDAKNSGESAGRCYIEDITYSDDFPIYKYPHN